MASGPILEKAAREFAEATAKPPFLFQIPPEKGRKAVDEVQSSPVKKPDAAIEDLSVRGGPKGEVSIRIVRAPRAKGPLPVVLYTHGAGWVFGNAHTHDRLIREIAAETGAAVVFTNYSLSPEAKYPTALEEVYAVLEWVGKEGAAHELDGKRLAIAGDSVGGNLTAAAAILAKKRGGPSIVRQLLFYPVTDASFDTGSYREFATGYFLRRDAMQWFWDQYVTDPKRRAESTASPLRAPLDELKGLPPALVITAEADVLRDEGEAYANRLREAGVRAAAARIQGTIHDFVMLNALAETDATRAAMALACAWLREGLGSRRPQ
jgi:acetyl esterase